MKKIITLFTALSLMASVHAQSSNDFEMTGPDYISDFMDNFISATGVSSNGQYVFGAMVGGEGPAAFYDIIGGEPAVMFEPECEESFGVTIAGITYDNIIFVSENDIVYTYDIANGTKTYITSPDAVLGLDVWDVTSDGMVIAGNLTDSESVVCKPMYGIKQADGTYKITALDFDSKDVFGMESQFTQARFLTEDGNNIIGVQIDARGRAPRLVVWEKQEDGSFKFLTPMDETIYDFSAGKPGKKPEFEDFVTADPETERDLYDQQKAEFNEAFMAYETAFAAFTRNGSTLDVFKMHRGKRNNIIYAGYNTEDGTYPILYNCDTNETTAYPDLMGYAFEDLPGGGMITFDDTTGLCSLNAVSEDGTETMFTEWLKDKTGMDISPLYSIEMTNPMTGMTIEGVFPGLPFFSHDGKTLALSGINSNFEYETGVYTFDRDIFAALATGIGVNVVSEVTFGHNTLNIGAGKNAVAEVYTMNGMLCGSYNVSGTVCFDGMLAAGTYIVKVSAEGAQPVSMKIMVK